ncbi:MAG: hypothetical protein QOE70_2063 [Chthoniobacter sp.]|nr:hypothetical protein [Chthoniobacter sp.]
MVVSLLTDPKTAALARPAPLPGGIEPEQRLIVCGLGWARYLAFDKALGDDRPGPRFYYLDGDLEIMTTSNEHERIKKWIGGFMDIFFEESEIQNIPRGQATMRIFEEAGAEPDESWCIREEKQWPDIVLGIALTSGGLSKLEIYRHFAVPEVWLWQRGKLEVFTLRDDGYDRFATSRILPGLPIDLIESCVAIPGWLEARHTFRAGLAGRR